MRQTCMCAIYCSHPSANNTMYLTCILHVSTLASLLTGWQIARHACRILVLLHWTSYTQLLILSFHVPDLISKPYLDRCLKENVGCCQQHLPPQNCIAGISNRDHIRNHCLMGMACRLSRWMDLHFWIYRVGGRVKIAASHSSLHITFLIWTASNCYFLLTVCAHAPSDFTPDPNFALHVNLVVYWLHYIALYIIDGSILTN